MTDQYFQEVIIILTTSLLTCILFQRLKLPTIVAYLLCGALIGPYGLTWVVEPDQFRFIAEFGVVFLLFSIGLEFSLGKLWSLKHSVLGLGSIQVIISAAVFGLAVYVWGKDLTSALVIAGSLALSSTAIVISELVKQHHLQHRHGQYAVGILLFQDLAAIIFLILIPVLGGTGDNLQSELLSALINGLILFAVLISFGKFILPKIYQEVSHSNSSEIYVLTTLVIGLFAAWLTHYFHLSMALGGFIIGMMMAETRFRHQIETDIRPFKDILLGLFFITIGMNIDIAMFSEYWFRILIFTFALIIIKAFLIILLVLAIKEKATTAFKTGLVLAQSGEFSLALITLAQLHLILPAKQTSFIMMLIILSMIISPFLIRHAETISLFLIKLLNALSVRLVKRSITYEEEEAFNTELDDYERFVPEGNHIIIGGFGRVGAMIADSLKQMDIAYIGLDTNLKRVEQAQEHGHPVVTGDCSRVNILQQCNIQQAKLAILTLDSFQLAQEAIEEIRAASLTLPIIVRCKHIDEIQPLLDLGANWVIPEVLETGISITQIALDSAGVEKEKVESIVSQLRDVETERQP